MDGEIDCSFQDILPAPTDGNLPGDIMVSIILNLPVKSLLKFKSVSIAWCCLISSSSFMKLHLHRQSLVTNTNFIVLCGPPCVGRGELDFGVVTHNNNHDKILIFDNQSFPSSEKKFYFNIVDSCNGLVCLRGCYGDSLVLWNPATKKYRYLFKDDSPYPLNAYSFGLCYVEATNDFKLVGCLKNITPAAANRSTILSFLVYSLSLDSWEDKVNYDTDERTLVASPQHPIFLSGCMHWLAQKCRRHLHCTCANVIVSFDVTNRVLSFVGLPYKNPAGFDSGIWMSTLVINGCLSIVIEPEDLEMGRGFDVWIMEDYGVEESWVKRFNNIQGLTQCGRPLRSWNDSEIVLFHIYRGSSSTTLTFYDPFSRRKYYLEFKSLALDQVFNYVESLASVEAAEGSRIGRPGSV